MRSRARLLIVLVSFPLACGGMHAARGPEGTVARVLDGDTIVLTDGRHVRLVQLDAPETDESECYAQEAKRTLEGLLPPGTSIRIETDPTLDKVDRFGRTLAYVEKNGADINLELIRAGAAAPWFYHGDRGRHAELFLTAARRAQHTHRGLWGECPATALNPLHSIEAYR